MAMAIRLLCPPLGDFGYYNDSLERPGLHNLGVDFSQIIFDGQVFVGLQARKCSSGSATKQSGSNRSKIKPISIKFITSW